MGKAGLLVTSLVLSLSLVGCTARALLPAELRPNLLSDLKVQAEAGDMEAQHELGRMYRWGWGAARDYPEAVKWFRAAAEQGHANAQYGLGLMYFEGRGVPQSDAEALRWYRRAAAQGHATAARRMCAVQPECLIAAEREHAQTLIDTLTQAAASDDASAQYELAKRYRYGHDVERDEELAVGWYRRAAQAGHMAAQFGLAEMHQLGRGVPENWDDAGRWYGLALQSGHPYAARRLDSFDELKALVEAARRGSVDAQSELGNAYAEGKGMPADYSRAAEWWVRAAEAGKTDAQHRLADLYRSGRGNVQKDPILAKKWQDVWVLSRYGTIGIAVPRRSSDDEVALERAKRDYHLTPGDTTNVLFIDLALHVMDLRDWLAGMPRTAEAKRAVKALHKQIDAINLPQILTEQLERAARAKLPNRIERPVLDGAQITEGDARLSGLGIDTLLEVTLQAAGLREHDSRGSRQFKLMLVAGARLIAAGDGSAIEETEVIHEGAAQDISYWLGDDSRSVQEALNRGAEDLGQQIVDHILK